MGEPEQAIIPDVQSVDDTVTTTDGLAAAQWSSVSAGSTDLIGKVILNYRKLRHGSVEARWEPFIRRIIRCSTRM